MKTLTIPIADDVYRRASQKAAAADTSLTAVMQNFLSEWTLENPHSAEASCRSQRQVTFLKFLDELAARPLMPGPSVGPLDREELYARGISGH